jgi:hypothetical protein
MTIVWPRGDVRDFVGTSKSYEGPYEGWEALRGHPKVASAGIWDACEHCKDLEEHT